MLKKDLEKEYELLKQDRDQFERKYESLLYKEKGLFLLVRQLGLGC